MEFNRDISLPIEWWLRSQNKMNGAVVNTAADSNTGKISLINWKVEGLPQPTDEELLSILDQYDAAMTEAKKNKIGDLESAKTKLGFNNLSDSELLVFLEWLRGR